MFTHHTPATLDARPNFLKLSESAFFQEVLQCFANVVFREGHISRRHVSRRSWLRGGHALERKPSNACAKKMPALTKPKIAVTVSIIANSRWPRLRQNDRRVAQSKEFPWPIEDRTRLRIRCNRFARKRARQGATTAQVRRIPGILRPAKATIDSPPRRSPHFRRVPPAVCSYVDAEMGCIGDA
jgi:hypothetical protein